MYVVYPCTSELQSRVVEQAVLGTCLMLQQTSIIFGTMPSNRIRGIAKKKLREVIGRLENEMEDTLSLLGCTAESDLLYIMEH